MRHITNDDWFKASTQAPEEVKVNGKPRSVTVSSGAPVVTPLSNVPVAPSTPAQANASGAAAPVTPGTPPLPAAPVAPATPMPVTPAPATLAPATTRAGRSSSNASKASSKAPSLKAESVSEHAAVGPSDPAGISAATDSEQLRKRDRLLQRIRGARPERVAGGGREKADAIDEEEGEFVNFEVGFQYRHSADARARGLGLHMLAYFGWGVKGVGGSEIPVYIDVVELKGKMLIRLLLTASPPFVRMATVTFLSMPEFNISARPLRSMGFGSINAMDLPLIKQYSELSYRQRGLTYSSKVDRPGRGALRQTETIHNGR